MFTKRAGILPSSQSTHYLDTCKSGLSSISNETSIDDSSNFIANSFKLQLGPEFENDDQIIDVQVILALSPENLSNWELQSVNYNYNQITSKFPTFNQPIEPNFDNFYQTVELVLGSQTWDALKISQAGAPKPSRCPEAQKVQPPPRNPEVPPEAQKVPRSSEGAPEAQKVPRSSEGAPKPHKFSEAQKVPRKIPVKGSLKTKKIVRTILTDYT